MSKLPVKNIQGESVGEFEVADALLVYDKGQQAVYESVVAHRTRQRAGTASTLGKGEVAGSGAKPWKQKGTGRARAGYQQSPVWRGGAVAFGPKPRTFDKKENKKTARLAFRRALSEKISGGRMTVVESLDLADAKTRSVAALLKNLAIDRKVLLVTDVPGEALVRAARNMPDVAVISANQVSTYELLRYPSIVVSRKGMDVLAQRLQGLSGSKA
jgi:large subunit ribosomal protein L4